MTREEELQQRIDALQALVTAPFIITVFVIIVVAILVTAAIERSNRS